MSSSPTPASPSKAERPCYYRRRGDELTSASAALFYRNGDPHFPGCRLVFNRRRVPNFDALLAEVTMRVKPRDGHAVRFIYTPEGGHRVCQLDSLQSGGVYVAAGKERFHKLDYRHITNKKPERTKVELIKPVVHSSINVSSRYWNITRQSYIVHIFTNGDILVPPRRLLIPKFELTELHRVLAFIAEKVHLRTGAVERLYTINGQRVLNCTQIEDNQYYVAVGKEKFKQLPYSHWIHPKTGQGILRETADIKLHRPSKVPPPRDVSQTKFYLGFQKTLPAKIRVPLPPITSKKEGANRKLEMLKYIEKWFGN